ncbi:hypothetical protein MtrunA17_Chr6g0480231 [Medicago truncatula]|uniref:Transmembrane protein n=1 Tax=Medicago truncatula TaxID=3880 RepID=A0A396HIR2_MEDTR|nr:hypothetical protein MtrunA17_Chr6g0480231 [Medicago truncatula]
MHMLTAHRSICRTQKKPASSHLNEFGFLFLFFFVIRHQNSSLFSFIHQRGMI